jgi:putative transposase
MKYRFMDAQRGTHRVEKMAEALGVSRSGYYTWLGRDESPRHRANRELVEHIEEIQREVKYRYGSPRVTEELRREGTSAGHNRVARLMREHGLQARTPRRYRSTTKASESRPEAPNVLGRSFAVSGTNVVWVSDITYIATSEGWLYLAVVLRDPPRGLIFHSDRGSQYTSHAFVKALQSRQMVQSMSRKGNCWDNAPSEAFFSTLKIELMGGKAFPTRQAAQTAIFEYMEVFYNRQRLHSSLGYRTPVEYEEAVSSGVPTGIEAEDRVV